MADSNTDYDVDPETAAAELFKRSLAVMGVIDTVWRRPGENVVRATTHGPGVHLGNLAEDFEADVHAISPAQAVELPPADDVDGRGDAHGPVYFNVEVRGVADDWDGHALPTHISARDGAHLPEPEARDAELMALAELAGLDLD